MNGATEAAFSARAIRWIVGVALGSFILAFVLAAYGDDISQPLTAEANTFSTSAIGHRALVEFLEASGTSVGIRRNDGTRELASDAPLVVAEPPVTDSLDGFPVLPRLYAAAAVHDAPFVLVLPKWSGAASTLRPRWLETVWPVGIGDVERTVNQLMRDLSLGEVAVLRPAATGRTSCTGPAGLRYDVELEEPQFLHVPEEFETLVDCDGSVLVARTDAVTSAEPLYLVADPDLLNNQGLGRADHAALVDLLLHHEIGASRIVIDEVVHGFARNTGLVAELMRFPLVLGVLHGALILGLVVWGGARRIGKPRPLAPRIAGGKLTLVDNAALLLGRGGHTVPTARSYYEQTLRAVAAHYFLPTDASVRDLTDRLQTLATRRGVTIDLADLGSRLHRLSTGRGRSPERAVKIALELHRFRQEMTDAARRDS